METVRELDATAADVLDALIEEELAAQLRPDEFTVSDYRKRLFDKGVAIARSTANGKLTRMVEDGKLTVRCLPSRVRAFRVVEGD